MNNLFEDHLDRLETAVLRKHSMRNLLKWVCEKTFLGGNPYSVKDREYQATILSDVSPEVNVQKPSQVGVSEASARLALAMVNVVSPLTVIYTLPTAHFAATFMKTRIDPVIQGSKALKANIHTANDNTEIKQFGDSFLYLKGAASSNAPISIPADVIINDEVDFSDQEVLSQYNSRVTNSKWKLKRRFSTPTVPDYGINKAFKTSRRFYNLCRCHLCNHWFLPSYYDHVRVPDFVKDLREVNKQTLTRIRWQEAFVECPKCGGAPSLQAEHREYVCENPDDNFIASGIQVTPFDAPNINPPGYLVKVSADYQRVQDFVNFGLGLPMEDNEATLTRADLAPLFTLSDPSASMMYVMGVDVGNIYHFIVAGIDGWGDMFVVLAEQVPMGRARVRYAELRRQFRTVCTVIDSGPHAETVMALQAEDPNLYASVYMRSKSILTHTVLDKEVNKDEGQEFLRQVNVNRSRALDAYMNFVRENHLSIRTSPEDDLIIQHHTSMKRVKVFDNDSGEMAYSWQKTDGEDHYHHASLYCWLAGRIRGVGRPLIVLPVGSMFKLKLKKGP